MLLLFTSFVGTTRIECDIAAFCHAVKIASEERIANESLIFFLTL